MLKARLFLASCLATALAVVPFTAPAVAQEEPQFDCSIFLGDYVFIPAGWTIWDLYESDGYTWTIRGDIALRVANELASSWAAAATEDVACVRTYLEAVAAGAVAGGRSAAESALACVTAAAQPLLDSDPLTSRYVEVGLDGVVHVHLGAVVDDAVALWNCNGVFVLPG